jgi:phosphoribosylglycinamide formyltransferase-1
LIKAAIFCSGSGSNAESLMDHFKNHPGIRIGLVLVNKAESGALQRAARFGIPAFFFSRKEFSDPSENILNCLEAHDVSFILLAGFLQLVSGSLIKNYPDKILNIHPALLPKFGGEGMYGHFVHEAVKAAGETTTGLTIHLVDEEYDKGKIIFQASCKVENNDSPTDIAARVLKMEHIHYPIVAEYFIKNSTLTNTLKK